MPITVGMVSLGCPKNEVDAEHILYNLREEGFAIRTDASLADVAIVNTCGFIEAAKQEAIETILELVELKKEGRIKAVIVTGCLGERYRDEVMKEIPELDAVVGIGANEMLGEIIKKVVAGEGPITMYGDKSALIIDGRRIVSTRTYAYIKIAEGCSNCCSYCAIPMIRGKYRSRTMESILDEAKWLAKVGYREIALIAQDTTRYGEDLYGKGMLPELLHQICQIDGLKWVRFLYAYPERITDELIETVATEHKCLKYFDIPIQHICDDILKKMNRKTTGSDIRMLLDKIRTRMPNFFLRTSLIAGFHGETEEQFEELCEFVKEVKFDRLGCFAYSQEEGTPAASMPDQIDEEEKQRRADIIMQEQMLVNDELVKYYLGRSMEIVVEGYDRYSEMWYGRCAAQAPEIDGKVFFTSPRRTPSVGEYVAIKAEDYIDYDLIGMSLGRMSDEPTQ